MCCIHIRILYCCCSGNIHSNIWIISFTFTRVSDSVLRATISDEPDIAITPISGLKIRRIDGYKIPAAIGNATKLQLTL
jgi:hypothetical protein